MHSGHGLCQDFGHWQTLRQETGHADVDIAEFQYLVDNGAKPAAAFGYGVKAGPLLMVQLPHRPVPHQGGQVDNIVKRGTQFFRHMGEKLTLDLVRQQKTLVCPLQLVCSFSYLMLQMLLALVIHLIVPVPQSV
jgi:hypothetical protein